MLWDVDLDLPGSQLTAIVGPNGAGKSTLVRAALDLVPRQAGSARFWDQPLRDVRSRIAFVPQKQEVDWDFPVTVRDVVLMGLTPRLGLFRRPNGEHLQKVDEVMERLGLQPLAKRPISHLSGGQQQRTFLARAMVQGAELLIMDEPFAGVDGPTEELLFATLQSLRDQGHSIVIVHHDLETVAKNFDHVVLLKREILATGSPSSVLVDSNLRLAYG
ncbi:MAG: metal ABC transporter ATP-binding protein [Fimbriimonadaceae bacterium]|nr:metal ABC transporter ATP-binding protein [Fimbriimonadaceae bacterium]